MHHEETRYSHKITVLRHSSADNSPGVFHKEMLSSLHVRQRYAAILQKDLPHGLETACGFNWQSCKFALVYSCVWGATLQLLHPTAHLERHFGINLKRKRIIKYQVIALVRCIKKQLCKQKNTEHGRFAQQKHENETHMKEPGNLRGRYFQRLAVSLASRVNFGFSDEQPCSPTSSLVLPPRSCLLIRVLISGWKSII